jgi:membrane-bound lytic murein transglycosylase MltF
MASKVAGESYEFPRAQPRCRLYTFGNTLLKRYQTYVRYFKEYATEYDFDYLMLVAQGYQESHLDQSRRNPSGAVGIMQVIPKIAAAPPINIFNVNVAGNNVHAGAKMLRDIADTYFKDPKLDPLNRTLMVFASYNASPTRIFVIIVRSFGKSCRELSQCASNPSPKRLCAV